MKKIIKNHLQRIGERQMNQSIRELIKDEELRNIIKTHRLVICWGYYDPENGTLDYIWGLKDKNFLFQWIGNGYSINEISKQAVDLRYRSMTLFDKEEYDCFRFHLHNHKIHAISYSRPSWIFKKLWTAINSTSIQ